MCVLAFLQFHAHLRSLNDRLLCHAAQHPSGLNARKSAIRAPDARVEVWRMAGAHVLHKVNHARSLTFSRHQKPRIASQCSGAPSHNNLLKDAHHPILSCGLLFRPFAHFPVPERENERESVHVHVERHTTSAHRALISTGEFSTPCSCARGVFA